MEEGCYSSNNIWMTYESMIVLRFILWKKTVLWGVLCHLFYGNYIGTQWGIQW